MLETVSPALNAAQLDAFRKGLRELGSVEGQTYAMEYRSADGYANRFPELAAELVRLGVDLIVVRGTPAAIAAELIRELVPTISRIALFANMSNAVAPPQWEETKTAARSLGIEAERGQPCELVHFCGRLTGRTGNRQSGESLCPT
jgi:putative ABC transport system substrate-binding protein